jgi:hypothetical protein
MTRIFPYLIAMSILLAGCMSGPRGPWIETDFVGPWCGAGERAEVYMRQYHNPYYKGTHPEPYLRYGSIQRSILIVKWGIEFSLDYFTQTSFWRQWPATGDSAYITWLDREVPEKEAPFRLYLVSISPTVIVGVSKEGDRFVEPEEGILHPLAIHFYGLSYYERVWIMTQLSVSPDARLVYFAPDLSMELEALNLDSGSTTISLPDGSQLTFLREQTFINIVRESKSLTR